MGGNKSFSLSEPQQVSGCCCQASREKDVGALQNLESAVEVKRQASLVTMSVETLGRQGGRMEPENHRQAIRDRLVRLEGGSFLMGTDDREGFPADGEGPVREVKLSPFYLSPYAVTNEEFRAFILGTGYVTDAERFGWSYVFHLFVTEKGKGSEPRVAQETPWWWVVEGASWAAPEGPGSTIEDRLNHPVIHISWHDAWAYCQWSGTRLPSEAEWEYASRGGLAQKRYPWGDVLRPDGQHRCNIWQGKFPIKNNESDGYSGTAPVDEYEPNGYGLYNMVGNVWEWCSNWFSVAETYKLGEVNPKGPVRGKAKSIRGGSYLCHRSYCNRYRVAARSSNTPDSSTGNMGFRIAADVE